MFRCLPKSKCFCRLMNIVITKGTCKGGLKTVSSFLFDSKEILKVHD